MSYFDRYIAKFPCENRVQCQLLAVTSLYMAIKMNEARRKDTVQFFCKLSAGRFTVQDIVATESKMLFGLNWLLNPPTPQSLVHQVNALLCVTHLRGVSSSVPSIIYEVVTYLTELSLLSGDSAKTKPSTLALASMLIVLKDVKRHVLTSKQVKEFINYLSSLGFESISMINSVAHNIMTSMNENECILSMSQIHEKLDPSRIVFNLIEDEQTLDSSATRH